MAMCEDAFAIQLVGRLLFGLSCLDGRFGGIDVANDLVAVQRPSKPRPSGSAY
jgi:hypothetical protein